jgi:two-component system, LuxR family, sensor kinase FixL
VTLSGREVLADIDASRPAQWLHGGAFVVVYLFVETATRTYQLDGLGITLWGPAAGLSVVYLLTTGLSSASFILAAAMIADFVVYDGQKSIWVSAGTSLVLTGGFSGLALVLRHRWKNLPPTVSDVLALLVLVPVGVLIIAVFYCSILLAAGLVSEWRFLLALRDLWIGDTLGIVTLLPAAGVVVQLVAAKPALWSRANIVAAIGSVIMIAAALGVIFGLQDAGAYQFFYLLFLPIIWIAVRWGYAGAAITLLIAHVMLVTVSTYLGYAAYDFIAFQMLMLILSATGLLLGVAITERRCAEERSRIQDRDLARASRQAIIGATGTAIAHEISQPLASATTYLHVARRKLRRPGTDLDSVDEALAQAEADARRTRETLERVRDYISSGRLCLTEIDVDCLVDRLAKLIGRDAEARGVSIAVSCANHLPAMRGDRIQLEQLILNLLSNGVDAAAERPGAGQVRLRIAQRRNRIAFIVDDNGTGVPAGMAKRMFEPFETSKQKGMGLGLTLVRQIVAAHGGTISWEGLEPRGTRFVVELPVDGPDHHGR